MNSNDNPPVVCCPVVMRVLVYLNFGFLLFVGALVLLKPNKIDDMEWAGFLGLFSAFIFQLILAFGIRDGKPGGRLRAVSHLLLIVIGPLGAAFLGAYIGDVITGEPDWGLMLGLCGSYLGLAVYFVSRPKNRGSRRQLLTHTLLIYVGPFVAGLIGGGIGWYGFDSNEAIALGAAILGFAYAIPVNLIAVLTQFGWKESKGTFHRVVVRLSWCGVGLVGLAVVGVLGYYLIGGWMGARAWAKHKAAGVADGWKYSMEEYIGEIPADDDNFFMAKPLNALLFTQEPGGKPVYKNPKAEEELDALLDRSPRSVVNGLRRVSNHMIFPDWRGFAQRLPTKFSRGNSKGEHAFFAENPPPGLSDEELTRHYFAQFDGLLSGLREAAKRPGHHFPIAYENGPDTSLPHLAKIKGVAQLLQYTALAKLDRGDVDGAMEDIRLQFRLFEASGAGLFTISQFVNISIGHITVDTINKCLHTGKLSDANLQELDRLLAIDTEYLGQMERAMQAERISMGQGAIEAYINGAEFDDMFNRRDNPGKLIPKGWHYKDLIFYDSTMKEYVSLIREAKNSGRIQQFSVNMLFMKARVEVRSNWHLFSGMLLFGLEKSLTRSGELINRFAAARLGVAIERHRLAKGTLPDNLDELTPTYIDAIPVDVLSGGLIAWERKGSHRYRIPDSSSWRNTWKYDPILAAIQLGDLERIKQMSDEGWVLTTPKPGEETKHAQALNVGMDRDPDPNYLGVPESVALARQGALKLASLSGNKELLQWLLDHGLTPGDDDLELAVELQQVDIVKILLDKGGLPPVPGENNAVRNRMANPYLNPYIPREASESLFEKANLEITKLLLAKVPESRLPKVFEEEWEYSLLRRVLAKGDLAKARLLIEKGADVNHPRPPSEEESAEPNRLGTPVGGGYGMPSMTTAMGSYGMGSGKMMPGMMGNETNDLNSLSVVALAARTGDSDFFEYLIEKGAEIKRREEDCSTPLHQAVKNPDTVILKHLLKNSPSLNEWDKEEMAESFAQAGTPKQALLLKQAGIGLKYSGAVDAGIRNGNFRLIDFMLGTAKKPLSENENWSAAFPSLEGFLYDYSGDELRLRPGITDEQFEEVRKLAALFLDNGLHSTTIQSSEDVAQITRESALGLRARSTPHKLIELGVDLENDLGVDSDGDGFDDYDEKITGHDPEDPDDTPTQKEVDAAVSQLELEE